MTELATPTVEQEQDVKRISHWIGGRLVEGGSGRSGPVYDPARGVWEFANESSVASDSTRVSGTIRAEPHPEGMLHVIELEIVVKAFGFGSMVERMIEKNTRDSYRLTTEFVNRYAEEHGLSP